MKRLPKLILIYVFICTLMLASPAFAQSADQQAFYSSAYLNGAKEYTRTGNTNLTDLVTDAMRTQTDADIALLDASSITASIPEGQFKRADVMRAIDKDAALVQLTVSGSEIKQALSSMLVLTMPDFPLFSGMQVISTLLLRNDGFFSAQVDSIRTGDIELTSETQYTLTTTKKVLDAYFPMRVYEAQPAGLLGDITLAYIEKARLLLETGLHADDRFILIQETVNTSDIISKLNTSVPDDVTVYLASATALPDTVVYSLIGKDRNLVVHVDEVYPYTLVINGMLVTTETEIDLYCDITTDLPDGRRKASSVDENAVYVDLRGNSSLPTGSLLRFYVGEAYAPGSHVLLYYYDQNHDIALMGEEGLYVDTEGYIMFPVQPGATYFINPGRLDSSSVITLNRSEPFWPGIIIIFAAFFLFVVCFLLTRKKQNRPDKG